MTNPVGSCIQLKNKVFIRHNVLFELSKKLLTLKLPCLSNKYIITIKILKMVTATTIKYCSLEEPYSSRQVTIYVP